MQCFGNYRSCVQIKSSDYCDGESAKLKYLNSYDYIFNPMLFVLSLEGSHFGSKENMPVNLACYLKETTLFLLVPGIVSRKYKTRKLLILLWICRYTLSFILMLAATQLQCNIIYMECKEKMMESSKTHSSLNKWNLLKWFCVPTMLLVFKDFTKIIICYWISSRLQKCLD